MQVPEIYVLCVHILCLLELIKLISSVKHELSRQLLSLVLKFKCSISPVLVLLYILVEYIGTSNLYISEHKTQSSSILLKRQDICSLVVMPLKVNQVITSNFCKPRTVKSFMLLSSFFGAANTFSISITGLVQLFQF